MKDKKSFGNQLEAFFEGKGFYIVLCLCAAVIGVSAWVLIAGTNVEENVIAESGIVVATTPDVTVMSVPEETEEPRPIETVTPTATPSEEPTSQEIVEEETAPVFNEEQQISPLFVRPVNGEILVPHTVDKLLYDETMEDWRAHIGIDIASEVGTQVLAVSGGTVKSITNDPLYGTTVTISHGNEVESIYSNLAAQPTVYEGYEVNVGDVIGAVGDTAMGESEQASHLHFSMIESGNFIDPENYLP